MEIQQQKLKNGLETLFINSPGSTSASVQIWFRAGSALESREDQGVAHFLEHMFFKGTEKRPGAKIANEVESVGGELNAFTSFDYTCYYINTPNSHLKNTVDILLDMVSNPKFKKSDLLPEREVVFEEYRRSVDNPSHYLFNQLQKNCFTSNYSHPILGREKTIKNFTQQQIRSFRKSHYNLSNAMLVVAGNLEQREKLIKAIEKYKMPKGPDSTFPKFKLKPKTQINVHKKDVKMATLYLTSQAPEFTQAQAVLEDLAVNCLGHGESSRLHQNLVINDSKANHSSASTMFMNNGGVHFLKVAFPIENLEEITSRLKTVFQEISDSGFADNEVIKIKNQYLASKIYEKESIESFAFSLGHSFAQSGDINSDSRFIEQIKKSSPKDVNRAFNDILNKGWHMELQVPMDADEKAAEKKLSSFAKDLEKFKSKEEKKAAKKIKTTGSKFDPQVKIASIAPGVALLHRYNPMTPTFVTQAYIKGGLSDESKDNNGIYHLLGSLLNKGHTSADYISMKSELDEMSSSLFGFSGKNAYGLNMHGLTENFPQLIHHLTESLLSPAFDKQFVSHELEMTQRQLQNQKEDPIKQCFNNVSATLFGSHPYGMNNLGTESTLKTITREQIEKLHSENLKSRDILFTYCGDLTFEEVHSHIMDKFSAKNIDRKIIKSTPTQISPSDNFEFFKEFNREQTQIFIGIPGAQLGHKDNVFLKMLTQHLQGQSSELFVDVRDKKGLCYTAQPIHFSGLEGGYWGIYMASGHDKVEAAIEAIQDILDSIKKNGLPKKSFERIKKMIQGQAELNIQTNEDYANIYSVPLLHGKGVDYYYKNNERVLNLSYDDFQKGIRKLLNRKRYRFVVGRGNKS